MRARGNTRGTHSWLYLIPLLCSIACGETGDMGSPGPGAETGGTGAAGAAPGGNSPGGNSPGGSSPAGAGGISGAGNGGTSPSGTTPMLDACKAYLAAQCHRRVECKYSESDCTESFQPDCPDVYFSPGSTRTTQSLLACAGDWATFPCDQLLRDFVPSCASPGTRAAGEACVFGSQCDSGACFTQSADECGICKATIAVGGACDWSDLTKQCVSGAGCVSSVCTPNAPMPETVPALGELCTSSCASGAACLLDASGAARCTVAPSSGQPCGKYQGGGSACAGGFACNASNVCGPAPVAGQPCAAPGVCGADAECDTSTGSSGTCVSKAALGATCRGDLDCMTGLRCHCVTGTVCASKVCMTVLSTGSACGQPNTICDYGMQCQGARCVPSDAVTTFADLCPGR
jgi:hypothetical protein